MNPFILYLPVHPFFRPLHYKLVAPTLVTPKHVDTDKPSQDSFFTLSLAKKKNFLTK